MKYCQPTYYERFICSASQCSDTCCRFWQVELDKATAEKYKAISRSSKVGARLHKSISGGCKNRIFKNKSNGDCPFLNECMLCDLHIELGHDDLPATCRLYPRFINNFGGYEERGLSFSCPTAAQLIYESEFRKFIYEDDLPVSDIVDLDAELFIAVRRARDTILEFIKAQDNDADVMLNSILEFGNEVQNCIDNRNFRYIPDVITSKAGESILFNEPLRLNAVKEHMKHKHLRKDWSLKLQEALSTQMNYDMCSMRVWMSYFIFRYLIKSVYDGKFCDKIKAAVLSYLVIGSVKMEKTEAMQKYSKETEHSEYNINKLFRSARRTRMGSE